MERKSPPRDDVSDALRTINVRSAVYCLSELGAPWGFRVARSPEPKFHLVLSGSATLRLPDEDEVASLRAGDVALLPRGSAHVVQDVPRSRAPDLEQLLARHPLDADGRLIAGGSGRRTTLLCGAFETHPMGDQLLGTLPPMLTLEARSAGVDPLLSSMMTVLSDVSAHPRRGASAVLAKVADVFITDALRRYLTAVDSPALGADLAAARDPAIAQAIRLLRCEPNAPWTVASLAERVGMSRTAFSARFRELVEDSPMHYLAQLRLSRAAGDLATSTKGIAEIARAVGFSNEASFSKAFRRRYGVPPGTFRARASTEPDWHLVNG